jgi:inorganic pyrophosphatase
MEFDVVVEVPRGSRNKYEVDHETGVIRLDRQLFTAIHYPAEYGFIDATIGEDGDPLDALVMIDEPTFPGCHISCRPIGVFSMRDEKGPDAKILALPTWDRVHEWTDVDDVPRRVLAEIRHFFDIYKDLEEGRYSEVGEWAGRADAEDVVRQAAERHRMTNNLA